MKDWDVIEKQLNDAYKRGAPQSEIDHLETELSKLVSEEEPTTEEDAYSEGISIDEDLIQAYKEYLKVPASDKERILGHMRSIIDGSDWAYTRSRPIEGITDAQILDAAKDVYEHHLHLKSKRGLPRKYPTPELALQELSKIRGRIRKMAQRVALFYSGRYLC